MTLSGDHGQPGALRRTGWLMRAGPTALAGKCHLTSNFGLRQRWSCRSLPLPSCQGFKVPSFGRGWTLSRFQRFKLSRFQAFKLFWKFGTSSVWLLKAEAHYSEGPPFRPPAQIRATLSGDRGQPGTLRRTGWLRRAGPTALAE